MEIYSKVEGKLTQSLLGEITLQRRTRSLSPNLKSKDPKGDLALVRDLEELKERVKSLV